MSSLLSTCEGERVDPAQEEAALSLVLRERSPSIVQSKKTQSPRLER